MFVITGTFLLIGGVLITSGVLPEKRAQDFLSLTDVSIARGRKTIKEPTLEDNTFIYAINDVAQREIDLHKLIQQQNKYWKNPRQNKLC